MEGILPSSSWHLPCGPALEESTALRPECKSQQPWPWWMVCPGTGVCVEGAEHPSLWSSKLSSDLSSSYVRSCSWSLLGVRGSLPL